MAIFREVTVSTKDWIGERRQSFVDNTQRILGPILNQNIIISVPHDEVQKPISDGNFYIWIWSAPKNTKHVYPPEIINSIRVSCRDEAFSPPGLGDVISDQKYKVAELLENNLYIFHDICHTGNDNELRLYSWILEKARELLLKGGYSKKNALNNPTRIIKEDPKEQSPNGLTKVQLLKDIDSAINPVFLEELLIVKNLSTTYEKIDSVPKLVGTVDRKFGKHGSTNPKIIEQEINIIAQLAKQLKIGSRDLHTLGRETRVAEYHNRIVEQVAKNNPSYTIDDYTYLYDEVFNCYITEVKTKKTLEEAIFQSLNSSTKYNLVEYHQVYSHLRGNLPRGFLDKIKEIALNVISYPSLKNLKIAKEHLGRDFLPKMEELLARAIEAKYKKLFSRTESYSELRTTIKMAREEVDFSVKKYHTFVAQAIKRLEIDTVNCINLKDLFSREEFNLLVETVAVERIYLKLFELENIITSIRLSPQAKRELDKLRIEAWQRRFDLIKTPHELGSIVRVLKNDDFYPDFAKMIITCSKRLKFKPLALCRLMKKRSISEALLNYVVALLVKQIKAINWPELRFFYKIITKSRNGSEPAISSLFEKMIADGLLTVDSEKSILTEAIEMFGTSRTFPVEVQKSLNKLFRNRW